MGLTLVTPPSTDFVTLDEATAHCRVTTEEEVGLIQGYVLAARQLVEKDTRRAFITQKWRLTLDGGLWPTVRSADGTGSASRDPLTGESRTRRIVLPKPPIQSVDSLTYLDTTGATQALDPSQFLLSKMDTGEWCVEPAYGVSWPTPRRQSAFATINFTAGYGDNAGDVPELARQAVLMLVAQWFDYRVPIAATQAIVEMPYGPSQLILGLRVFY